MRRGYEYRPTILTGSLVGALDFGDDNSVHKA
jgi:hypothetical protein